MILRKMFSVRQIIRLTKFQTLQKVSQAGLSSYVKYSENCLKHCQFNNVRQTIGTIPQTDYLCKAFTETKNIDANINSFRELPYKQQLHISFLLNSLTKCNLNFPSVEQSDSEVNNYLEMPGVQNNVEKQAARLIVIRRRKMRIHKLKKLRKKMKFVWAKVRQKREAKKEKAFQAELVDKIKLAEKFDAAKYVAEKLQKSKPIEVKVKT